MGLKETENVIPGECNVAVFIIKISFAPHKLVTTTSLY